MRKMFYVLALLIASVTAAVAQDTKVYVGFATLDYDLNRGITASVQRKLYGHDAVKLEGVVEGTGFFYEGRSFQVFQAGPQVSLDVFDDKLTPFARVLFGASKDRQYDYVHSVGVGIDVNLTDRVFVRGTQDKVTLAGGVTYRTTLGAGFRF